METIIINNKCLMVEKMGTSKFAYEENVGCCTIISNRMVNGVKIFTPCNKPLYQPAVDVGLMGCRVNCENCLRKYFAQSGLSLEKAIKNKVEHDRKTAAGEYKCDRCGSLGARLCPGEGQYLCDNCNDRTGINRWS